MFSKHEKADHQILIHHAWQPLVVQFLLNTANHLAKLKTIDCLAFTSKNFIGSDNYSLSNKQVELQSFIPHNIVHNLIYCGIENLQLHYICPHHLYSHKISCNELGRLKGILHFDTKFPL